MRSDAEQAPFDGVALAWSIVEYMVQRNMGETRTIFATHYHELTELEGRLPQVFTMNISNRESRGDGIFFHKPVLARADLSCGIDGVKPAETAASLLHDSGRFRESLKQGRRACRIWSKRWLALSVRYYAD